MKVNHVGPIKREHVASMATWIRDRNSPNQYARFVLMFKTGAEYGGVSGDDRINALGKYVAEISVDDMNQSAPWHNAKIFTGFLDKQDLSLKNATEINNVNDSSLKGLVDRIYDTIVTDLNVCTKEAEEFLQAKGY